MQQSFYTALSGASSHQQGLGVWANNLANVNTAGYRYDTVEFKSLVSDQARNPGNIANKTGQVKTYGSKLAPNTTNFSQSSIVNTGNEFDLSLNGKGFFVVGDISGNLKYTRDGSFTKNASGYLTNSSGHYLYGIDLHNVENNILIPTDNGDGLKTQKVSDLSRIKIPNQTQYQPHQTKNMNLAFNLNSTKNIVNIQDAYSSMLYEKDIGVLSTSPLLEFINIKKGDILKINTSKTEGAEYKYGTDFTNLEELQEVILRDRDDIRIELKGDKIIIVNHSGEPLDIDYDGSNEELKNALSLNSGAVLGKDSDIALAPFTQRQQYNTKFNALYAENEFPIYIKRGDEISININGEKETMFYGPADGFTIGGKTIAKKDSFQTIGEFIDKMERKTNTEIYLKDNRLIIKNKSTEVQKVKFSSSNPNLIKNMGLSSDIYTLSSGASASTDTFGVSTYTDIVNVYNEAGKKFNMQFSFVSQGLITSDSNEKWHTSMGLYDGHKLVSEAFHNGTIEFHEKDVEVDIKEFNTKENKYTIVNNFTMKFPENEDITINMKDDAKGTKTSNLRYIESSISKKTVDGNQEGKLERVVIDEQGTIRMSFTNKAEDLYGRIGIVDFINKNGLQKTGNNLFKESYTVGKDGIRYPSSGGAYFSWDKDGVLATSIGQNSLETSNTDLTKGLTQLIVMQRSFSANSKVISTSDEMMQQAINLKG